MAAPKGNKFWELRSKHGRNMIFSSSEMLWESCKEYFEAQSERFWTEDDWVGKDAHHVIRKKPAPFTQKGLCLFLGISRETWNQYKKKDDFSDIITRVEDIIFTQKFEGAVVGQYNSSIIAKELGLADKKEIEETKFVVTTKKRQKK
jgi:hypothetical protein